MTRQPPAVRFQAEHSNALWHFDMSPSDLKQLPTPPWIDPDRSGAPTLMLFSVVDDRSGAAYQEYRCVYGEDAEGPTSRDRSASQHARCSRTRTDAARCLPPFCCQD